MEKESLHMMRLSIELLVGGVLLTLIFLATSQGRDWFARERANEGTKLQLKNEAEIYSLLSGEPLTGNDIVEFILKHDMKYDYYIERNSHLYEVTATYSQLLERAGYDGDLIWSYDYLNHTVFGRDLMKNYQVSATYCNDDIISFTFHLL